jgi:CRP/FNR family transcriptional regulator, cyclic AMP receptor protein
MNQQFSGIEQVGQWPAGSMLFREGDVPRGIYVVHSGSVDLVFSSRNGVTKPLRTIHPGEVVGLSDAVSNMPHDCTATVRVPSRIGFVAIAKLRKLLEERPATWFAVAEVLSADINACWGTMRAITR